MTADELHSLGYLVCKLKQFQFCQTILSQWIVVVACAIHRFGSVIVLWISSMISEKGQQFALGDIFQNQIKWLCTRDTNLYKQSVSMRIDSKVHTIFRTTTKETHHIGVCSQLQHDVQLFEYFLLVF